MINPKHLELSRMIFDKLKEKFPEIELVNIVESAEDPNTLWVRIAMPEDDDREFELHEMVGDMSADIMMDYGHHILTIVTLNSNSLTNQVVMQS